VRKHKSIGEGEEFNTGRSLRFPGAIHAAFAALEVDFVEVCRFGQ